MLRLYVGASVLFWVACLLLFDDGTATVHFGLEGAVVNLLLLPFLWRASEAARIVLVIEAGMSTLFIARGAVDPFALLAPIAGFQMVLLWRLRPYPYLGLY